VLRFATPLFALVSIACAGGTATRSDPALAGQAPARAPRQRQASPLRERAARPSDEYAGREPLAVLRGRASYYSDRLAGRHTANGDVYDPHAFTAANRDLPFGTVLRVVREDTGASVIVRVNDRGPFRDHARILDLSRAAAEALDMIGAGVVQVRAEILERPERH
jgi:rare lipoprotein A